MPSQQTSTVQFPSATVHWRSANRSSEPRAAWLCISTCVRWRYIESQDETPPDKFLAFRGHECLILERLPEGKHWKDVVASVHPTDESKGLSFVLSGVLQESGLLGVKNQQVQLIIEASSVCSANAWIDAIRLRISPWQILYQRMSSELLHGPLTERTLQELFMARRNLSKPATMRGQRRKPSSHVDVIEKAGPIANAVNVLSGFAETVAVTLKTAVPLVKDTAENVADFAKCVSIVSSAFQVVTLCANLVEMGMEMKRAKNEWPRIQVQIDELRQATVKSMVFLLHPDGAVDELLVKDVFQVQQGLLDVLTDAEHEMMRVGSYQSVVRFFKSQKLKQVEEDLLNLKRCVLNVVQSGAIAENSVAIQSIVKSLDAKVTPQMRRRPKLTSFFVGRKNELDRLKEILQSHGAAAIMQYGGVGKTQLATAFAENAELGGLVPGGSYWIRVGGGKSQVISAIADFTEALTGVLFRDSDREDYRVVLNTLERGLQARKGNWLLCLDNADDPEINGLIGEVIRCRGNGNGWILVTSRQGAKTMWEGMVSDQKLQIGPFGLREAMIVLFRRKHELVNSSISDSHVQLKLDQLEKENYSEFVALSQLAGNTEDYSLGGLPLALAQAGSFVHRRKATFAKYIELLQLMWHSEEIPRMFLEIDGSGLETDHQKTIWKTWKINVDTLTDTGREVLSSFALLDDSPVPIELVERLHPKFSEDPLQFSEVVQGELVDGSSLLHEIENEGSITFGMHRLLREFVLHEVDRDLSRLSSALLKSGIALYKQVDSVLTDVGESIEDTPEFCYDGTRKYLSHIISILLKPINSGELWNYLPEEFRERTCSLFSYSIRALRFLGRYETCFLLCKGFVGFLEKVISNMEATHEKDLNFRSNRWLFNRCVSCFRQQKICEANTKPVTVMKLLLAVALDENGLTELELGSISRSAEVFRRSLHIKYQVLGERTDHEDLAWSSFYLGRVEEENGAYDKAEEYFSASLHMLQRLDMDESTMLPRHHLAVVLLNKGMHEDAENLQRECLVQTQEKYGFHSNHPDIIWSQHELGNVMLEKGDLNNAEDLFSKCLHMNRQIYGEETNHPSTAWSIHQLARVKLEKGMVNEAHDLALLCFNMRNEMFSNLNHPDLAWSLHTLGCILLEKKMLSEAEQYFKKSLAMREKIHGKSTDHEQISWSLHEYGRTLSEKGVLNEAESLLRQAYSMRRRLYGESSYHPDIAWSLNELGCLMEKKGMLEEASHFLEEAYTMRVHIFGDNAVHTDIAWLCHDMGNVYLARDMLDEAERKYMESVSTRRILHGADGDHPNLVYSLYQLGVIKERKEQIDQAESFYSQSTDMEKRLDAL